jgi:hydrogenase nickel incorporation protein HypA/HybF
MHELAICQALVSQVEAISRQRGARVHAVRIAIGPLAGIEPALLADAYPLAGAGTAAEGSRLLIEERPIRVRCRVCSAEGAASVNRLLCGDCGDWRADLISGDEMLLLSIELDVPETAAEACHV